MEKSFELQNIAFIDKRQGEPITTETLSVTQNGTFTADAGKAYSSVIVNVPAPEDYIPTFIPQFDPDETDILITNLDSFPKDAGGDFYPYVIFSPAQAAYNMEFNFDNATKIRAFIARLDSSGNYISPAYYEDASEGVDGLITIDMTTGQLSINRQV